MAFHQRPCAMQSREFRSKREERDHCKTRFAGSDFVHIIFDAKTSNFCGVGVDSIAIAYESTSDLFAPDIFGRSLE